MSSTTQRAIPQLRINVNGTVLEVCPPDLMHPVSKDVPPSNRFVYRPHFKVVLVAQVDAVLNLLLQFL